MAAIMLTRLGVVMEPAPSLAKHNILIEIHEFLIARQALLKDREVCNSLPSNANNFFVKTSNQSVPKADR